MLGTSPVVLGPLELVGMEVPTFFDHGGRMRVAVHHVIGGDRVIQILGADPQSRSLQGCFIGPTAAERAQLLEALRDAGQPLQLTIGAWTELVLITGVVVRYGERGSVIHYAIEAEAMSQGSTVDITSTSAGLSGILDDLGRATDAVGNIPDSPLYFPLLAAGLTNAINSLTTTSTLTSSSGTSLFVPGEIISASLIAASSSLTSLSANSAAGSIIEGSVSLAQATQDALIIATACQVGGYVNRAGSSLASLNGTSFRPVIHS